jgi:ammonium transporter, Amt family
LPAELPSSPGALTFESYFVLVLLAPLAFAGVALIGTGLSRSRSAAHTVLTSMCVFSVAMLAYFVCGFAFEGIAAGPSHILEIGNRPWNLLGAGSFFLAGFDFENPSKTLMLLLQMFSVTLAAAIPAVTGAERWRLAAACSSTALFGGFTYPLFAHWVWSNGWLAQLGVNYGLGHGFSDPAGAGCIHAVGGLTALAVAWILGPRQGKFTADAVPNAIPGHNAVVVLFGCLLALVGWMALNSAGAALFAGAQFPELIATALNTSLCAASSALSAFAVTRTRFGKPDASLTANGWVSGLVASSAVCHFVKPVEAVIVGLVAGSLVIFSIELLELRMRVDDPAGAISVHAVGGMWGILCLGIFGRFPRAMPGSISGSDSGQFLAQLVGVATLLGFVLPLSYGLNWLLDRVLHQRVSPEGERQGMDLFELGAGAYPDFMTHRDDFLRR